MLYLEWDRRDTSGSLLPSGTYSFKFRIEHTSGQDISGPQSYTWEVGDTVEQ